jgi:hypothetical protein
MVSVSTVGTDAIGVSDLKESRKSRNCAEAYPAYAAQEIPQADTEIAEKGRFETETSSFCRLDPDEPGVVDTPGERPRRNRSTSGLCALLFFKRGIASRYLFLPVQKSEIQNESIWMLMQ